MPQMPWCTGGLQVPVPRCRGAYAVGFVEHIALNFARQGNLIELPTFLRAHRGRRAGGAGGQGGPSCMGRRTIVLIWEGLGSSVSGPAKKRRKTFQPNSKC